jgi:hypothetical protein
MNVIIQLMCSQLMFYLSYGDQIESQQKFLEIFSIVFIMVNINKNIIKTILVYLPYLSFLSYLYSMSIISNNSCLSDLLDNCSSLFTSDF